MFRSPIPATTAEYVFDQPWTALRSLTSIPTALGTAHPSAGLTPDYSTWYCVAEGEKQDVGNGIVKWNRTYAQKPASHDEWESYSYNFVGFAPLGAGSVQQVGRFRFSDRVTTRVQHDYFLIAATGGDYTSAGAIPVNRAFKYVTQPIISGTQYGGYNYLQDYVCDSAQVASVGYLWPTVPSATQYLAMCKDALVNGWAAGVSQQLLGGSTPALINVSSMATYPTTYPSGTPPIVTCQYGQIVAEDSQLSRWMGPIYLRQTRYVLAR